MSAVGDAARGLLAAASEADDIVSSLVAVRVSLAVARADLAAAVEGSAREEPLLALASVDASMEAVTAAGGHLTSAGHALRTYVGDVLAVSTGDAAPGVALGVPSGGGRLRNAERARIDPAKFVRYSMDPASRNNGKWRAWQELGYDLEGGREAAAADVECQLRAHLPAAAPFAHRQTDYGERCRTRTPLRGPNGCSGTLVCVWQFDRGSDEPKMLTNWLEVHRRDL